MAWNMETGEQNQWHPHSQRTQKKNICRDKSIQTPLDFSGKTFPNDDGIVFVKCVTLIVTRSL